MIILDIVLYCCCIVDEGWLSSRDKRKYGSKLALSLLMVATGQWRWKEREIVRGLF
jgi:hypothetical protein